MFGMKKKADKKVEKKAAPAPKAAPAKKAGCAKKACGCKAKAAPKAAPAKESARVYHVVKRDDGKWAVKFAGGEKVIKLFDTQVEAKEYTAKMAENQGGAMLVHNSKGASKGQIKKK